MRSLEQTWVRESGCKCDVPHKPGYIDTTYGGEGLSIWCPGWKIKKEIGNTNPFNS